MNKINQAIGCEVSDCMYNCDGKNCTLDRITVGNTCDCDAEKCTCCENYRCKYGKERRPIAIGLRSFRAISFLCDLLFR